MGKSENILGMYELLDAVELTVHAAEPALKQRLSEIFDGYAESFPEEYFWATSAQAPALLHNLMYALMPIEKKDELKTKVRPDVH